MAAESRGLKTCASWPHGWESYNSAGARSAQPESIGGSNEASLNRQAFFSGSWLQEREKTRKGDSSRINDVNDWDH
jgi:hypothetical protein